MIASASIIAYCLGLISISAPEGCGMTTIEHTSPAMIEEMTALESLTIAEDDRQLNEWLSLNGDPSPVRVLSGECEMGRSRSWTIFYVSEKETATVHVYNGSVLELNISSRSSNLTSSPLLCKTPVDSDVAWTKIKDTMAQEGIDLTGQAYAALKPQSPARSFWEYTFRDGGEVTVIRADSITCEVLETSQAMVRT